MITGTVKFFNADKGYGFIQPDDNSGDAFVHITAVEAAGMRTLDVPAPHFTDRVDSAQQLVASRDRTPSLAAADRDSGRRGVWLRTLDRLGLGYDS